ncbi:hypothetical protein C8F04DRAFT_1145547 [Mycena alexandri]|uniref:F-box domain-containing protein n=1 Tax=Mycena alexandri TaxID=1745969 RepID=A0AAD6WMP3_9AGAR|nr:hypothetical protein C8F04DRAFT_1145547 [Mycena alexandri]
MTQPANGTKPVVPTTKVISTSENLPIPATDIPIARATLLAARKELSEIDKEIHALELRRSAVLSRIELCTTALAPHKSLPVEIIGQIFTLCAPGAVELNSIAGPWYSGKDIRLILCQICSRWRTTALHTFTLWNDVKINFRSHKIVQVLKLLPIWLGRAGESTLSLHIEGDTDDPRVLSIVSTYAHRCHALVLGNLQFDNPFFDLPASTLSRLETMCLVGGYKHGQVQPDLPTELPVFADASLLRSATLHLFDNFVEPFILYLPWRQFTSLYFDNTFPTPSQYYSILGKCENVERARLDLFPSPVGGTIELSGVEIALPALQTLELNTDVLGNAARFLHSVALHALVDLSISLADDYDNTIFDVRCFPAMQRLSIDECGRASQRDLEAWLRACPAAVDVWVPGHCMQQVIVDQIADGRLLPRLQFLVLEAAVPAFVIAALEARQRSTGHSTIVEVGFTGSQMTEWELESSERMRIARLRMVGVYMAVSTSFARVPGEIGKLARLNAQQGRDPFVLGRNNTRV